MQDVLQLGAKKHHYMYRPEQQYKAVTAVLSVAPKSAYNAIPHATEQLHHACTVKEVPQAH